MIQGVSPSVAALISRSRPIQVPDNGKLIQTLNLIAQLNARKGEETLRNDQIQAGALGQGLQNLGGGIGMGNRVGRNLDLEERRTTVMEQGERDRTRLMEEGQKLQNRQFAIRTAMEHEISPDDVIAFLDSGAADKSPEAGLKLVQQSDAEAVNKLMKPFKEGGMEAVYKEMETLGIRGDKRTSRITGRLQEMSQMEIQKDANKRAEDAAKRESERLDIAKEEATYEKTLRPMREKALKAQEELNTARAAAIPDETKIRKLNTDIMQAQLDLATKELPIKEKRLDLETRRFEKESAGASPEVIAALNDPSMVARLTGPDREVFQTLYPIYRDQGRLKEGLTDDARKIVNAEALHELDPSVYLTAARRLPSEEQKAIAPRIAMAETSVIEQAKKYVTNEKFDFEGASNQIHALQSVQDSRKYQASDAIFEKLKNKVLSTSGAIANQAILGVKKKEFVQGYKDLVKLQTEFGVQPYVPVIEKTNFGYRILDKGAVGTPEDAQKLIEELSK